MNLKGAVLKYFRYQVQARSQEETFYWSVVETILFALIAIALGYFLKRTDPLLLGASFPWLLLSPVFIALRYGSFFGLINLVIILAVLYPLEPAVILQITGFDFYLLGSVLLTVICGESSTGWAMENRRGRQLNNYTLQRLDALSRTYYLARLSHAQLEQSLITRPVTLRHTFDEINALMLDKKGKLTPQIAHRFLSLLAQYCGIEQAAFFVSQDGDLLEQPVAFIGNKIQLDREDPLVKQGITNDSISYHAVNQFNDENVGHYLAVAPVIATDKHLVGLIIIDKMRFSSLNDDVLEALSVLTSCFANDVHGSQHTYHVVEKFPDCPSDFAHELGKLAHLCRQFRVESSMVAFVAPKGENYMILKLEQLHRGLDYIWIKKEEDRTVFFTLMPFSGPMAVLGYFNRVEQWLKTEFGMVLGEGEVFMRYQDVDDSGPVNILQKLYEKIA